MHRTVHLTITVYPDQFRFLEMLTAVTKFLLSDYSTLSGKDLFFLVSSYR
jgi:hypothetical protein